MYSHHDHDLDIEDDFWPMLGILLFIIGVWTGIVHLIDWFTIGADAIITSGELSDQVYENLVNNNKWNEVLGVQCKVTRAGQNNYQAIRYREDNGTARW